MTGILFNEHDTVILTDAVKGDDDITFVPGDVGCIIHVHDKGTAYVLEFTSLDGETVDIATVRAEHIRNVTTQDMTHARETSSTR